MALVVPAERRPDRADAVIRTTRRTAATRGKALDRFQVSSPARSQGVIVGS